MSATQAEIAAASARGYPTERERRQWTPEDWEAYRVATTPRRSARPTLVERVAALEETVLRLERHIEVLSGRPD